MLAPAALVVCAIAFFAIVLSSGGGGGEKSSSERAGATTTKTQPARSKRRSARVTGNTYTVRTGDTLGGISEKTGVDVEKLQELNPDLDPQALVSGQKLKLR